MQINYVLRPDWRYQKAEGTFSYRLWVSYLDERDDYKTVLEVSKDDYEKLQVGKNLSAELRLLRDELRKLQAGINNYIKQITEFEFDLFERNYINYNPLFVQRKKKMGFKKQKEVPFDYTIYEKRFPLLTEEHPRQDSISIIFQYLIKAKLRYKK